MQSVNKSNAINQQHCSSRSTQIQKHYNLISQLISKTASWDSNVQIQRHIFIFLGVGERCLHTAEFGSCSWLCSEITPTSQSDSIAVRLACSQPQIDPGSITGIPYSPSSLQGAICEQRTRSNP